MARRLGPAPLWQYFDQKPTNDWLQTITERANFYEGSSDPSLAEVPLNQWIIWRNTSTGDLALWANDDGTLLHTTLTTGGGGGDVVGPLLATDNHVVFFDGATGKLIKDSGLTLSGTNTGDQTTITGITGTKAQFNLACTDGDFLYVGDVTQYTDEMAQDAVGTILTDTAEVNFTYNDAGGTITADLINNSIANARLSNMAASTFKGRDSGGGAGAPQDLTVAQAKTLLNLSGTNTGDQTSIVGITGTTAQFNTALTDNDFATLAGVESLTNKKLGSLTTNGFVKTSGGDGTLSVDTTSYQTQDATLSALAAYNTNGILAQTAADTFAGRTITGTANQITVTDGNGVGGNPTLSLPVDVIIPTVLTAPNTGLHLLDTDASHDLIVKPGSNLSADRTLTITTGDSDRTLTLSGNADITGTNTGDQTSVTGNAGTVTIADESADTTCFPLFATAASGSLSPKTNATNLTFNASTGLFKSANFEATTADINGGTVDGATIGANSATTGKFTTVETSGNVRIGGAPGSDVSLMVNKNIEGGATAYGLRSAGVAQSGVTTSAIGFEALVGTAAASFTVTNLRQFSASQGTFGASSTVTNQFGFIAESALTGATNNYGFYGNIAAASGRWNIYMNGTAQNALAGLTRFGSTTVPVNTVDITGSLGMGAPVTKTGDFTLAATENWVICNKASSTSVTLPAASSWTGRIVHLKTIQAQTVVSASSNVVPITDTTAGTAILPATDGAWCTLVSDGTNWIVMQRGT